ncbi:MAG: DnaJ domain-containing protein [Bacteriovoracia bacterium]
MRHLILIPLVIASAVEYLSQGQFGLGLVSALYMILSLQAESAAKRFLRDGLRPAALLAGSGYGSRPPEPRREKIRIEDVLDVKPLGEKKREGPKAEKQEGKKEKRQEAPPRAEQKAKAESPKPQPKPAPKKELPKAPLFHGKPHEVLAVRENAATQTIVKAFRHWVKQYHPDHARTPQQTQSANEHTRCLTDAKEKLLERRKQMRKPSAA